MKNRLLFFLSFFIGLNSTCFGQTSPIGVMPMAYNSSFAGSAGNSRISSHISYFGENRDLRYKNVKRQIFNTYTSFDRFYPGIRSGIGITFSTYSDLIEDIGDSWSNIINIAAQSLRIDLAPKFSINGKYTISPSLGVNFSHHYFNSEPPSQRIENGTTYGLGSRLGILFNADHYYIGYTISFLSSDFSSVDFMTFNSNLHFGYTFQRSIESKFSFTPQLMILIRDPDAYYWEHAISNIKYNMGFRYGQFLAGILCNYYSELLPTGFQLGWQKNGWRIISSNEFYFEYYNWHQPSLSVRYIFTQNKKSIHIYEQNF